jgi:hypothetical protein
MSDDIFDVEDLRMWRKEWNVSVPHREHLLERRVEELEDTVSRLEKEIIRQKQINNEMFKNTGGITQAGSIGAVVGTIGMTKVLPASPHKAD